MHTGAFALALCLFGIVPVCNCKNMVSLLRCASFYHILPPSTISIRSSSGGIWRPDYRNLSCIFFSQGILGRFSPAITRDAFTGNCSINATDIPDGVRLRGRNTEDLYAPSDTLIPSCTNSFHVLSPTTIWIECSSGGIWRPDYRNLSCIFSYQGILGGISPTIPLNTFTDNCSINPSDIPDGVRLSGRNAEDIYAPSDTLIPICTNSFHVLSPTTFWIECSSSGTWRPDYRNLSCIFSYQGILGGISPTIPRNTFTGNCSINPSDIPDGVRLLGRNAEDMYAPSDTLIPSCTNSFDVLSPTTIWIECSSGGIWRPDYRNLSCIFSFHGRLGGISPATPPNFGFPPGLFPFN